MAVFPPGQMERQNGHWRLPATTRATYGRHAYSPQQTHAMARTSFICISRLVDDYECSRWQGFTNAMRAHASLAPLLCHPARITHASCYYRRLTHGPWKMLEGIYFWHFLSIKLPTSWEDYIMLRLSHVPTYAMIRRSIASQSINTFHFLLSLFLRECLSPHAIAIFFYRFR